MQLYIQQNGAPKVICMKMWIFEAFSMLSLKPFLVFLSVPQLSHAGVCSHCWFVDLPSLNHNMQYAWQSSLLKFPFNFKKSLPNTCVLSYVSTVTRSPRSQFSQQAALLKKGLTSLAYLLAVSLTASLLLPRDPRHRHTALWEGGKSQDIAASLSLVCIVEQPWLQHVWTLMCTFCF